MKNNNWYAKDKHSVSMDILSTEFISITDCKLAYWKYLLFTQTVFFSTARYLPSANIPSCICTGFLLISLDIFIKYFFLSMNPAGKLRPSLKGCGILFAIATTFEEKNQSKSKPTQCTYTVVPPFRELHSELWIISFFLQVKIIELSLY